MVGMMYRAEKIRRQQTLAAILVVMSVFILTGISLFTTDQFEDQEMLPLIAFAAGYLSGSIPLLNQVERGSIGHGQRSKRDALS
jgi:cytochrome c biogenesis protein CcdA